eukprot:3464046-Rhodomonas_salina.1
MLGSSEAEGERPRAVQWASQSVSEGDDGPQMFLSGWVGGVVVEISMDLFCSTAIEVDDEAIGP